MTKQQTFRIIEYLKTHDGITDGEAYTKLKVRRLASRIHDIKKLGFVIDDEWITFENEYGTGRCKRYSLGER